MLYINDNALWNEVEETITILMTPSGKYYELNRMGLVIWKLIAEGKTKAEIINIIQNTYNVPKWKIWLDVNILILRLISQKILIEK